MSFGMKSLLVAGACACTLAGAAHAIEYKRVATIMPKPHLQGSFDIGTVDPATDRYYLSFGEGKVLLIFDAKHNKFLKAVPVGSNPHGNSLVTSVDEVWTGDSDGGVAMVDAKTMKHVGTVKTAAKEGADETAYDPKDDIFAVATPDDDPPALVLIKGKTHKILATNKVTRATDGLEQTIYSETDGLFYTSVPELDHQGKKGGILVTDPKTLKPVKIIEIDDCYPKGNVPGPNGDLLLGCDAGKPEHKMAARLEVYNIKTGATTPIPGVGGADMVAYDPGLGIYAAALANNPGGGIVAIIDAKTKQVIQKIPMPTAGRSHSVAIDPNNHEIFVPSKATVDNCTGCVSVFAPAK